MPDFNLNLLKQIQASSDPERAGLVFQNPVVLSTAYQTALRAQIALLPADAVGDLTAGVDFLAGLTRYFKSNPAQYQLGPGPMEQLWTRIDEGEVKAETAMQFAGEAAITGNLSPVYVAALSGWLVAMSRQGRAEIAVKRMPFLRAATKALPESSEAGDMRDITDFDWIEIVHDYLIGMADGRLFRDAFKTGSELLARTASSRTLYGDTLNVMGTLHLDPYSVGRDPANYDLEISHWRRRFVEANQQELAGIPRKEWEMPEPKEALAVAEKYLRQAAAARSGSSKALSLKALAQTLNLEQFLKSKEVASSEVVSLCKEALGELDASVDPQPVVSLLALLSVYDEKIDRGIIEKIFETSLDDCVRRFGARSSMEIVTQTVGALSRVEPGQALGLIQQNRPLFEVYGGEAARTGLWRQEIRVLGRLADMEVPADLPAGGLATLVNQTLEVAQKENWSLSTKAERLFLLAGSAGKWNEEQTALQLLDYIKKLAPVFAHEHRDAMAFLAATHWVGLGSNAYNGNDYPTAVQMYAQGCLGLLDLKAGVAGLDCLSKINDLADKPAPRMLEAITFALALAARRLQEQAGDQASKLIYQVVRRTVAACGQAVSADSLCQIWQFAKGFRFAHALLSGRRYRWQENEQGKKLLGEIQQAQAALGPFAPAGDTINADTFNTNQELLVSYTGDNERMAGETPEVKLMNLRQAYDRHVNERLLSEAGGGDPLLFDINDIQSALDERTVLAHFYLGAKNGQTTVFLLLISREEIIPVGVNIGFPASILKIGHHGQDFILDPIGISVAQLREKLLNPPGPWPVSQEAAELLEKGVAMYFGSPKILNDLRAKGKDHLCIVPHGPLHYFPFHLIGPQDKPLAGEWIVTFLPNLHLLSSRRGLPEVKKYRPNLLTAIGLGYETANPFNLSKLPQSIKDTEQIASIFGVNPILDEQATAPALVKALQTSYYVHLSMHGQHVPGAPSFQCLYLASHDGNDGRFYAHDLLSADLRGLDLVTLSACETALGRFDLGDNLRGLPANFLLAGVTTLIGTLWEVNADASGAFFSVLYQSLHDGKSRLDAFAEAQRQTRQKFPQYRDWGAFYFAGDWL
jgi:CHAT domain-containing protein